MDYYPALYRGCLLGEYDSPEEAEAACAELRLREQAQENDFDTWLNQPVE